MIRAIRQIWRNQDGVSALEFALISPAFITLLIGTLDIGQMAYGKSILSGAVQKAARDSALETADTGAADTMVRGIVGPVLPGARITSQRASYYDYTDIGRPERWNDADNDGTCDHGEAYVDENGSGQWEADIGVSGNGGASDVVVYTVTVSYEPVFKVPFIPSQWNTRQLVASAVKKNQPYANQDGYSNSSGVCL